MNSINDIEILFNNLMNEIYTHQIDDISINILSHLALIFKQYVVTILNRPCDNIITTIVGGAPADVSNAFFHNEKPIIKDVDIATNLTADQIEKAIQWYINLSDTDNHKLFDVKIPIHLLEKLNINSKNNGTINIYVDLPTISMEMRKLEITTFRKESGQRGKHQTTAIGIDIPYDVALEIDRNRRDLTIGTVFAIINTLIQTQFIGKFFGPLRNNVTSIAVMDDVKNGIVKFMSNNPYEIIWQDSLRLLRLIRKSAKLHHQPDLKHLAIALHMAPGLHIPINVPNMINNVTQPVSGERILHPKDGEIIKLFELPGHFKVLFDMYTILKNDNIIDNAISLYLPKYPSFTRLSSDKWTNKNDKFARLTSLFLSSGNVLMPEAIDTIRALASVDHSIMGENRHCIFVLLALSLHIGTGIKLDTKKDCCIFAKKMPKIMLYFSKTLYYSALTKITSKKIISYLDQFADFQDMSQTQKKFLKITYQQFENDITVIKKTVYTTDSILKSNKSKECTKRITQLINALK
jgi:hypothetical protein